MPYKEPISAEAKALAYYLRQKGGCSYQEIARVCKISKASAIRYGTINTLLRLGENAMEKRRPGRKPKLSEREVRQLIRCVANLRCVNVNFTVKKLVEFSGLDFQRASYRTYVRCLNQHGYGYRQTRKKGLLSKRDKYRRLKYAKECKTILKTNPHFFTKTIAFYLDAVSFIYKSNPMGEAMRPKARVWRKRSEGLEITAKGSKNLAGGKRVHVLVIISHNHGVILVEEYEKMNGKYFSDFIKRNFDHCFKLSGHRRNSRIFIMDNDPSQTSALSREAMKSINATFSPIPARSPDLNPIESVFNLVKEKLNADAISKKLVKETYEQFRQRVKQTLSYFNNHLVDTTIVSMPKRIDAVIKAKGGRTKY